MSTMCDRHAYGFMFEIIAHLVIVQNKSCDIFLFFLNIQLILFSRRGLTPPHRVKSISMATFSTEEIDFIKSRGNEVSILLYCLKTDRIMFYEIEMSL